MSRAEKDIRISIVPTALPQIRVYAISTPRHRTLEQEGFVQNGVGREDQF